MAQPLQPRTSGRQAEPRRLYLSLLPLSLLLVMAALLRLVRLVLGPLVLLLLLCPDLEKENKDETTDKADEAADEATDDR